MIDVELAKKALVEQTIKAGTCRRWVGETSLSGKPVIDFHGVKKNAVLVSYKITHGSIPEHAEMVRSCRYYDCVNPEHVKFLTAEELAEIANPTGVRKLNRGGWHASAPSLFGIKRSLGNYPTKERAREAVIAFTPRFEEIKKFHDRYPADMLQRYYDVGWGERTPHQKTPAGANSCFFWPGAPTAGGYGVIYYTGGKGRTIGKYTHQLAYELEYGPVPEGKVVINTCGQKMCINPLHVEAATRAYSYRNSAGQKTKKSKLPRGVSKHTKYGTYYGRVYICGKVHSTKYHKTVEGAHRELVKLREKLYEEEREK